MKQFTESDVQDGRIICLKTDLERRLLPWQERGLQQTRTGYGSKLTSEWMIWYEGRLRRVYITCYSNVGSAWITVKGKKIHLSA